MMKRSEMRFPLGSVVTGAGIVVVAVVLLCGLLAALILRQVIRPELGSIAVKLMALAGTFLMCWRTAGRVPQKRMYVSLSAAAVVVVAGFVCKVMMFPQEPVNWYMVLLMAAAAVGAGLYAGRKKTRRR